MTPQAELSTFIVENVVGIKRELIQKLSHQHRTNNEWERNKATQPNSISFLLKKIEWQTEIRGHLSHRLPIIIPSTPKQPFSCNFIEGCSNPLNNQLKSEFFSANYKSIFWILAFKLIYIYTLCLSLWMDDIWGFRIIKNILW